MITQNSFCYWDCKSDIDAIILIINAVLAIVISIWSIKYAYEFRKKYSRDMVDANQVYHKFIGVVLWAVCFNIVVLYSVIVYFTQYRNKPKPETPSITEYSQYYAFIQTTPSMIVQTLLFNTSKTMMTNSLGVLLQQQMQPTRTQRKIYIFITKYYWIRYSFLLCWVLVLIPIGMYYYEDISRIKVTFMMLDCLIICIILAYSRKYMMDKSQNLLTSRNQRNQLNTQTKLLIFCAAVRLVTDFVFYLIFPFIFAESTEKPCIQQATQHLQFTIGYLIIGTYLMHHVSMIVILRIYRPVDSKSIIRSQIQENQIQNQVIQNSQENQQSQEIV